MEKPNYQKIYQDIINRNYPDKQKQTEKLLKKEMTALNVIKISEILNVNDTTENQKHKSYDLNSILEILNVQKLNNFTNIQVSEKFRISRNTVAKWKKIYG
ncbi:hypothetical protein SAMN05421738_112104 [Algoriella xinjiangensis]|uniref:Helix-turn-helix domain-containing protein n=1 Tax=Algoriella xinjiangensis TaxID=684065 RepID=A0A1I4Z4B3_9FLAO|nr:MULTISPECIES: hypothetical protein [Algoriella]MBO6212864.1 helix-turn-helix domain-containing protein [Algoriella sp.]SFN45101.1 hypothetical protein SAMN05421738_112104 [Algoriella xinjiangensis]VDH16527.1 Uncharacterised protein [Algoriella xinjiangensis]